MPFEKVNSITLPIGAALAAKRFVTINTSGQAIATTAVTSDAVGITLEGATAAEFTAGKTQLAVAVPDGSKVEVEASEAIAIGELVGPATDGRARDADTPGDRILGVALTAAAAAGETITMLFLKSGNVV